VLPSGETETGSFSQLLETEGLIPISFPIPLEAGISGGNILFLDEGYDGEDEVGAEHEKCPGKAANPQAKAGFLCVYTGKVEFSTLLADPDFKNPVTGESTGTATSGVSMVAASAGAAYFFGTFAVTAP